MAPEVDPRLRRFLAHHAVTPAQEAEADVAEARGATPAERWSQAVRLSRSLAWLRTRPLEQQARVLEWRDPPAESYRQLVARLRAARPA